MLYRNISAMKSGLILFHKRKKANTIKVQEKFKRNIVKIKIRLFSKILKFHLLYYLVKNNLYLQFYNKYKPKKVTQIIHYIQAISLHSYNIISLIMLENLKNNLKCIFMYVTIMKNIIMILNFDENFNLREKVIDMKTVPSYVQVYKYLK